MRARYHSDPEAIRRYYRAYYAADPERQRRAQLRCHTAACVQCGEVGMVQRKADISTHRCRRCAHALRRVPRFSVPCAGCGHKIERRPSQLGSNSLCKSCHGAQSTLAEKLGVSRQYVSQLVAREMWRGCPTRAEALRRIERNREVRSELSLMHAKITDELQRRRAERQAAK